MSHDKGIEFLKAYCEVISQSPNPVAKQVGREILDTLATTGTGSLKAFMSRHDGMLLTTVQFGNERGDGWVPVGRRVDASRSTYVTLAGSRRDYAGMRVVAATVDCIVVQDDWHTVAYVRDVRQD